MVTDLVVKIHTTKEEFEALKKEWSDLLFRSHSHSVFLTWEWLFSWWCHVADNCTLWLLTVRNREGKLMGIGPFCTSKKGIFTVRILTFLGTTRIASEYLDIIASQEHAEEVALAMTEVIFKNKESWDLIELSDLLDNSAISTYFKKYLDPKQVFIEQSVSQSCPYLKLPHNREAFFKMLGPETRATLKRRTKKLRQLGAEMEILDSNDKLASRMNTLFSLHGKRWALKGLKGNLGDDPIRDFHEQVTRNFLDQGWLRLYSLKVNDKVIASLYAFQFGKTLFYYQAGFDPEWSDKSPGFVLMGQCIEDAIDRGLTEFDYLRGLESYKSRWTKTCRETFCLTAVPSGHFRGYLHVRSKKMLKTAKGRIKQVIFPLIGKSLS